MSGATTGKIGVNQTNKKILLNQRVGKFEPKQALNKLYLFNFLLTKIEYSLEISVGAAQPNLSTAQIKNFQIPLPPLHEQKRIVAILDQAFTAIDQAKANTEKNLKNARELFQSKLQETFDNGKLKIDTGEWEEKKLGEVCDFIRGPFGGSLKKSIFVNNGIAVYEQKHAIHDQFDEIRYFITDDKFKEMQRFELFSGDLIMSCSGTMGKTAIVPEYIKKGIINQALLKLTTSKKLEVEYLNIWMGSKTFQKNVEEYAQGAAIKNVASVKTLKQIKIPLPMLSEQKKIVKKLDAVSTETKKLEAIYQRKITCLDELKKSILQKAFSGEL